MISTQHRLGRRAYWAVLAALVCGAAAASAALPLGCGNRRDGPEKLTSEEPRGLATRPHPEAASTLAGLRNGAADASLIIVVIDAARADRFGAYGYHRDTTPNLDRFLGQGVVFEEAYTEATETKTSVCSLFTSQFPDTHGVVGLSNTLPETAHTLAEQFHEAGFVTAAFSASPYVCKAFGMGQGFDEVEEIFRGSGARPNQRGMFPAVPAKKVLKAAVPWLEEHADDRFLLYLHFLEPHTPYTPPEPYWSKYDRGEARAESQTALYDGNLAYVDNAVGRLLGHIERVGLAERSVIVVLADHGEATGDHGYFGHSNKVYEEIVHIPLGFWLPPACGLAPGRRSGIVRIIDLMPTLLDLFGIEPPGGMQGRSLLGLLVRQEETGDILAVTRARGGDQTGGVKHPEQVSYALTVARYTLILAECGERIELYDRDSDPKQLHDIAETKEDVAAELERQFEEWAANQRGRPVVLEGGEVYVAPSPLVKMDHEIKEQLRTLGYLK